MHCRRGSDYMEETKKIKVKKILMTILKWVVGIVVVGLLLWFVIGPLLWWILYHGVLLVAGGFLILILACCLLYAIFGGVI